MLCPTIYVNKYLSHLTYGRAPTNGGNPIVTRNRRIKLARWVNWHQANVICRRRANKTADKIPALAQQMIAIWAVIFANVRYKFPKNNIEARGSFKDFSFENIAYFYFKLSVPGMFVCIYKLTENFEKKIDVIYNIIWKVLV